MFNVFKTSTVSLAWGVYIEASLFNHSCMPNVCLFRCHHTPEFQFVAIHDVPKGAELNVTYLVRYRYHLVQNKKKKPPA
jgi:hypothetical protein